MEPTECPGLLERLAEVSDPRASRGMWRTDVYVLALAASTVLTGATSPLTVSEWAVDVPKSVLAALGGPLDVLTGHQAVPGEATL